MAKTNTLTVDTAAWLQSYFTFKTVALRDGSGLIIVYVPDSGLMLRAVGPNGTAVHGHSWNPAAHGDQNVYGEPILHLTRGFAPYLFHGPWNFISRRSPILLLNLWQPVQAVRVQPLVLMDTRTLRAEHQLKYHIHAKDENIGERLNDCWYVTMSYMLPLTWYDA